MLSAISVSIPSKNMENEWETCSEGESEDELYEYQRESHPQNPKKQKRLISPKIKGKPVASLQYDEVVLEEND